MSERGWRAPLAVLGAAVLLVAGVLVVGDDARDEPLSALGTLPPGGAPWCPQSSVSDAGTGRFALDGRVRTVRPGDVGSVLGLEVLDWFRGPPLGQVDVEVAPAPANALMVGDRLLVQGSWRPDGASPVVDGCRARTWTAPLARAWAGAADGDPPGVRPVLAPGEPLARYDAVGFRRTGPVGGPVLTGVLVREGGCVYVADGRARWLPVFPSEQVDWDPAEERVSLSGFHLRVGQEVRLGGAPEHGELPLRGQPLVPGVGAARLVDPAGIPAGCDPDAPRFVVGEPPDAAPWTAEVLSAGDPVVRAVREGARRAGLEPSGVAGRLELDEFGGQSIQLAVAATAGPLGEDVSVSIGTVPVAAWPDVLDTADATVRSTADGSLGGLPAGSGAGGEVVAVERAGRTHVLVRTPGRVVVSVTVPLPATDDRVATMAGLARAVASGGVAGRS